MYLLRQLRKNSGVVVSIVCQMLHKAPTPPPIKSSSSSTLIQHQTTNSSHHARLQDAGPLRYQSQQTGSPVPRLYLHINPSQRVHGPLRQLLSQRYSRARNARGPTLHQQVHRNTAHDSFSSPPELFRRPARPHLQPALHSKEPHDHDPSHQQLMAHSSGRSPGDSQARATPRARACRDSSESLLPLFHPT
jgi:hypothetical protein